MSVFIFVPMPTRSEELMARVPMPKKKAEAHPVILETNDEGEIEKAHADIPEQEYSREARGEAALNQALERGRAMRDSAAEKVVPLLASIRSRISSYATRALSLLKSTIGFGGEALDATSKTLSASAEVGRELPGAVGKMAGFVYEDAVKPVGEAVRDLANPAEIDTEKLAGLDGRILSLSQAIDIVKNEETRMALDAERQKLEDERQKVLHPPQSQRKGAKLVKGVAGAVLGAGVAVVGGAAMGAAAGYNAAGRGIASAREYVNDKLDARRQEQEARALEQEEARVARAELFLMDAAEAVGASMPTLSREALIALGKGLEESFTQKLARGVREIGKGMLLVDDLRDMTGNLRAGASEFKVFLNSPEDQAWLISELQRLNVEAGAAIEEAFKTTAKKGVVEPVKRAGRATGRAAVAAATGTLAVGAGLAMAGAEAVANTETARKAKEAVIAKWEEHKPAVQRGFASTVDSMNQLAENLLDAPDAIGREANVLAETMNQNAEKAVGFMERMQRTIETAMRVAQRKWNELKREILDEAAMSENPDVVAGIDEALDAIDDIEGLPDNAIAQLHVEDAPTPRNVKPVIRVMRGSGTRKA